MKLLFLGCTLEPYSNIHYSQYLIPKDFRMWTWMKEKDINIFDNGGHSCHSVRILSAGCLSNSSCISSHLRESSVMLQEQPVVTGH